MIVAVDSALYSIDERGCAGQEVTGEEDPVEQPKAALGGLFGRAKSTAQVETIPCSACVPICALQHSHRVACILSCGGSLFSDPGERCASLNRS